MNNQPCQLKTSKKFNKVFIFSLVFNACLGAFFFGYQMGDLNILQGLFLNAIYPTMTTILLGLCGALVSFGAMFGAISSGSIANKIGRKKEKKKSKNFLKKRLKLLSRKKTIIF